MPATDKPCDIHDAFNFKQDVRSRIGHVTELTIGGTALEADITLKNPEEGGSGEGGQACVGAIGSFFWDGGYAEPVSFSMQLSAPNKNTIATMLHQDLESTEVLFSFFIYEYDHDAKKYYESVKGEDLKGVIQSNGGRLNWSMDEEPSGIVQKPQNYTFRIGIAPEEEEQVIHLAIADTKIVTKHWGVALSGS